jgi:hypothetical protein
MTANDVEGIIHLALHIGDMKMIIDCLYLAAMNTPGGRGLHSSSSQLNLSAFYGIRVRVGVL